MRRGVREMVGMLLGVERYECGLVFRGERFAFVHGKSFCSLVLLARALYAVLFRTRGFVYKMNGAFVAVVFLEMGCQ